MKEPIEMKAGDERVLVNGLPLPVDYRIVWEENYKELKRAFDLANVSGMLPTDEEIINEAEGRYPVKTHSRPDNSPYVGKQKTFIHGVRWALAFIQGNYR